MTMNKSYFVYILTNYTNSVFYIGITNNLQRRIFEHKTKVNPDSFTGKYRLYKLIWFEEFPTAQEAIIIEKRIKGWTRIKKIKLITSKNPSFKDLNSYTKL